MKLGLYAHFVLQCVTICFIFVAGIAFVALMLIAALIGEYVSQGIWLPALAWKSAHRLYSYGVPFRETWLNEYEGGDPYDPSRTFRTHSRGVIDLFGEIARNLTWSIGEQRKKLSRGLALVRA